MNPAIGEPRPLDGFLFVLPFFPADEIGGVTQAVMHLIDHINDARSYTPYLLICNGPANLPKIPHIRCPAFSVRVREAVSAEHPIRAPIAFWLTLPFILWKLRSFIKKHNIRRINFQFPDRGALTFVLLRVFHFFSGKVILTLQGNDIKLAADETGIARLFAKLTFRLADVVIACSHGIRQDLLRLEPRCERNSVVVYNSIDMRDFLSLLPSDFTLPPLLRDRPYLLNIGKYEHKKGQDVLIQAFERICPKFPDLCLVLIGQTGPDIEHIRRLVQASPVAPRILMLENVPHNCMPGFLHSALLFVLPSRREGFPFVILEAAACRKAVVAAACVGVPEVIQDGVTGRIVPVDDSHALATAIADLVANDATREIVADNLHRSASENFTWTAAFAKYMSL